MNESKVRTASSINGHMIALRPGHSIAIYERDRECYVAEFRDGRSELVPAGSWFRFNAGGLRYCHNGRAALQFSAPLTREMLQKIERLHDESDARQQRMLAMPRTAVAAARRYWINVISRLRGCAATISQTFG
jgi:hypothetical protein